MLSPGLYTSERGPLREYGDSLLEQLHACGESLRQHKCADFYEYLLKASPATSESLMARLVDLAPSVFNDARTYHPTSGADAFIVPFMFKAQRLLWSLSWYIPAEFPSSPEDSFCVAAGSFIPMLCIGMFPVFPIDACLLLTLRTTLRCQTPPLVGRTSTDHCRWRIDT